MLDSKKELIDTFYKGQLYHPSMLHYPDDMDDIVTVFCDNCKREDISICKGYNNFDLCIDCWKMLDILLHDEYTMSNSYYNILQETEDIFNKYVNNLKLNYK